MAIAPLAPRPIPDTKVAFFAGCSRLVLGIPPDRATGTTTVRDSASIHLPAQSTPFIGREDELAEVAIRLSDPHCRLPTLVGPGDSGKSRLALEAAAQLNSFEHGVFTREKLRVGRRRRN